MTALAGLNACMSTLGSGAVDWLAAWSQRSQWISAMSVPFHTSLQPTPKVRNESISQLVTRHYSLQL
jgi:hypothetical protein